MNPLNVFFVFYINIFYSSISFDDRVKVINICYWPLLNLCDSGFPISIQISGASLEIINSLDKYWVDKFMALLKTGKCELIGNGYSQIISPLVPADVNNANQLIGKETYSEILSFDPAITSINEMAYSSGSIEHYVNNNYKAILMEWENPSRSHPSWNEVWQYFPQTAIGVGGCNMPLIWVSSIAFQKFQRYVHGELELNEYINFLEFHRSRSEGGYFCLYASDTEIFDFRPGRYSTEADLEGLKEWKTIYDLLEMIKRDTRYNIIFPSEILDSQSPHSYNSIRIESPDQPIPVKKQEKYNIYRWALTGRDDLSINTKCYSIYKSLSQNHQTSNPVLKELCFLWSSDFRTHIEAGRWKDYISRLNKLHESEHDSNIRMGDTHSKIGTPTSKFSYIEDETLFTIETNKIKCVFSKLRGFSIKDLIFKDKSDLPLIGSLQHGYYENIAFSADFYSCHTIIEKPAIHKITDLTICSPQVYTSDQYVNIVTDHTCGNITIKKEYSLNIEKGSVSIYKKIKLPKREPSRILPESITFIPTSFDKNTLYFSTHNGGSCLEKYEIGDEFIHHSQSLSPLISAKHGLGATEGVVYVGDADKCIKFCHDQTRSSLIPSIQFDPNADKHNFFLRLNYSAQEIDETFKENDSQQIIESMLTIS